MDTELLADLYRHLNGAKDPDSVFYLADRAAQNDYASARRLGDYLKENPKETSLCLVYWANTYTMMMRNRKKIFEEVFGGLEVTGELQASLVSAVNLALIFDQTELLYTVLDTIDALASPLPESLIESFFGIISENRNSELGLLRNVIVKQGPRAIQAVRRYLEKQTDGAALARGMRAALLFATKAYKADFARLLVDFIFDDYDRAAKTGAATMLLKELVENFPDIEFPYNEKLIDDLTMQLFKGHQDLRRSASDINIDAWVLNDVPIILAMGEQGFFCVFNMYEKLDEYSARKFFKAMELLHKTLQPIDAGLLLKMAQSGSPKAAELANALLQHDFSRI